MAQAVKCLLCNHKDLSSSPRTHMKRKEKLGVVAFTFNLALGCRDREILETQLV